MGAAPGKRVERVSRAADISRRSSVCGAWQLQGGPECGRASGGNAALGPKPEAWPRACSVWRFGAVEGREGSQRQRSQAGKPARRQRGRRWGARHVAAGHPENGAGSEGLCRSRHKQGPSSDTFVRGTELPLLACFGLPATWLASVCAPAPALGKARRFLHLLVPPLAPWLRSCLLSAAPPSLNRPFPSACQCAGGPPV